MTMNAGTADTPGSMAAAIYDKLETEFGSVAYAGGDDQRKEFCRVVAEAVVGHITANAAVAVNVASVSGVTIGGGISGTGTGTGSVS